MVAERRILLHQPNMCWYDNFFVFLTCVVRNKGGSIETNFTGNGLLLTAPSCANFLKAEEVFSFWCKNGWFTWLQEVFALDFC